MSGTGNVRGRTRAPSGPWWALAGFLAAMVVAFAAGLVRLHEASRIPELRPPLRPVEEPVDGGWPRGGADPIGDLIQQRLRESDHA